MLVQRFTNLLVFKDRFCYDVNEVNTMASIKDVAAKAQVSISTVSIIINGKSKERKISKETQEKVLNAMKEL